MSTMRTKTLPAGVAIRATGDEPEITITTPARDLMRDTIDPLGMDVASYLRATRAVNFAHDHGKLPIGKTLSLAKSARGITAKFRWLAAANPEAATVRAVFEEGVLGASVEFVPGETAYNSGGGCHYLTSTLTGWALTSNPANPECVRLVKSLGLAGDAEIDLDAISHAGVLAQLGGTAFRSALAAEVRAKMAAAVGGGADVLELDDDVQLDPAEVRDALRAAIPEMVREAVNRTLVPALKAARGRVD
jgi:hypothetical protein